MDKFEDARLRNVALRALDEVLDASREFPTRAELRNLSLPVKTPHLVDTRKGIWNPQWLLATLSVVTTLNGPYPDREIADGLWEYRYRDGGPDGDNRKLQRAADLDVDLIYFREVDSHRYQPVYPVRIVQNDPAENRVLIARKDLDRVLWSGDEAEVTKSLRSWATREVKVRKHQRRFRDLVIGAYEGRCAICQLPIESLLDAAHIDADSSIDGEPVVDNGLALCKLHHYAYDANLLGISSARRIHVSEHVLALNGGAMLTEGLQAFNKQSLVVPHESKLQPNPKRLSRRWTEFRSSATT